MIFYNIKINEITIGIYFLFCLKRFVHLICKQIIDTNKNMALNAEIIIFLLYIYNIMPKINKILISIK